MGVVIGRDGHGEVERKRGDDLARTAVDLRAVAGNVIRLGGNGGHAAVLGNLGFSRGQIGGVHHGRHAAALHQTQVVAHGLHRHGGVQRHAAQRLALGVIDLRAVLGSVGGHVHGLNGGIRRVRPGRVGGQRAELDESGLAVALGIAPLAGGGGHEHGRAGGDGRQLIRVLGEAPVQRRLALGIGRDLAGLGHGQILRAHEGGVAALPHPRPAALRRVPRQHRARGQRAHGRGRVARRGVNRGALHHADRLRQRGKGAEHRTDCQRQGENRAKRAFHGQNLQGID